MHDNLYTPPPRARALETHLIVAYSALTEALTPVPQTGQTLLYLGTIFRADFLKERGGVQA